MRSSGNFVSAACAVGGQTRKHSMSPVGRRRWRRRRQAVQTRPPAAVMVSAGHWVCAAPPRCLTVSPQVASPSSAGPYHTHCHPPNLQCTWQMQSSSSFHTAQPNGTRTWQM